jgi:hypothetical protein
MSIVAQSTQQHRGIDTTQQTQTGRSSSTQRRTGESVNLEGGRVTRSESIRGGAVSRQIEQGHEVVNTQKQHASIVLNFSVSLVGFDPTKRYRP